MPSSPEWVSLIVMILLALPTSITCKIYKRDSISNAIFTGMDKSHSDITGITNINHLQDIQEGFKM